MKVHTLVFLLGISFSSMLHASEPKDAVQYCSMGSVNVSLGAGNVETLRLRTSNLCLTVAPNLATGQLVIFPGGVAGGAMRWDGDWAGYESAPETRAVVLNEMKSQRVGSNRIAHFMKMTVQDSDADVYLTIFTNKENTALDSVAMFGYHQGQEFREGKKSTAEISPGFADSALTLSRSILLPRVF